MKNWVLRISRKDIVIDRFSTSEKRAKRKAGIWNRKFPGQWSFTIFSPSGELLLKAKDKSYRLTWEKYT